MCSRSLSGSTSILSLNSSQWRHVDTIPYPAIAIDWRAWHLGVAMVATWGGVGGGGLFTGGIGAGVCRVERSHGDCGAVLSVWPAVGDGLVADD